MHVEQRVTDSAKLEGQEEAQVHGNGRSKGGEALGEIKAPENYLWVGPWGLVLTWRRYQPHSGGKVEISRLKSGVILAQVHKERHTTYSFPRLSMSCVAIK